MKVAYTSLLLGAIVLIQCLIGGTRLVFSLPAYALLGVAAVLSLGSFRRALPVPHAACLGTSAVFFSYILARAAYSPVACLAWNDLYMVLACLVAYFLVALYLTGAKYRRVAVIVLLLLALAEFCIALRQFKNGDNWMPFGFTRSNYGARASGMFISSIHLAGYLEAVGVLALSFAIWSSWRLWARITAGYGALLCYIGVAMTGSRGGYLSSAFSLIVFAAISVWTRKRADRTRLLVPVLCVGAGLVALFALSIAAMQQSPLLRQRLGLIGKPDVRIYNWQAALDQFRAAPWVGTGAGTHLYFGRLFRRPQIQADPEHAHSDYLEMLAEYGLVGLLGMIVLVSVHVRAGGENIRAIVDSLAEQRQGSQRSHSLALQIGALAALAAYVAHSVTDFNLHIPGNALVFAFIFGVLANPGAIWREPGAPPWWLRIFQVILPGLGAALLFIAWRKFPAERLAEQTRVAVRDHHFEEAERKGREALQLEPQNAFLYFYTGEAHRSLAISSPQRAVREEHLHEAVAFHHLALRLFPQDETTWLSLAFTQDALHQFREAETAFRHTLELDPNLGVLHAAYAGHLHLVGRTEEARAEVNKAQQLGGLAITPWVRFSLPEAEPMHPK